MVDSGSWHVTGRKVQVDLLRLAAVILVLLFHFDKLIWWGYLGVDVFFVISGYLVSRPLLENLYSEQRIGWRSFLIKRAFKILPSYFFFLVVASILVRIYIMPEYPLEALLKSEYPAFAFFYVNYVGTLSWCFGHIWSLCVEEHFYLLLPLYLVIIRLSKKWFSSNLVGVGLVLIILLTFVLRIAGYLNDGDTFEKTHLSLDGLCYGVLIAHLEMRQPLPGKKLLALSISILLLGAMIFAGIFLEPMLFTKLILHTFTPILVSGILIFLLLVELPRLPLISKLASNSYNWYLWHPIVGFTLLEMTNFPVAIKFVLYLVISYLVAIVATRLVEVPFLKMRAKLLKKMAL